MNTLLAKERSLHAESVLSCSSANACTEAACATHLTKQAELSLWEFTETSKSKRNDTGR